MQKIEGETVIADITNPSWEIHLKMQNLLYYFLKNVVGNWEYKAGGRSTLSLILVMGIGTAFTGIDTE